MLWTLVEEDLKLEKRHKRRGCTGVIPEFQDIKREGEAIKFQKEKRTAERKPCEDFGRPYATERWSLESYERNDTPPFTQTKLRCQRIAKCGTAKIEGLQQKLTSWSPLSGVS
ncbi:unnamed protein product [Knipowitschia caucasica]